MAAKKNSQGKQPTPAQIAALKKTPVGKIKPTEAATKKGQAAKGLSKSTVNGNRFSSTAKGTGSETKAGTFVKKATETVAKGTISLSGAGGVGKAAINPTKKNILNAAIGIAPLPVGKATSFAMKNSYTLGKTVIHASPVKGLKQITPQVGSRAKPTEKVVFGLNPKGMRAEQVPTVIGKYAKKAGTEGSYYVGKLPRKGLETSLKMPGGKPLYENFVTSAKPIKKLKEIPGGSLTLTKDISKALNKKGAVDVVNKTKSKVNSIKTKKQIKKVYPGDL